MTPHGSSLERFAGALERAQRHWQERHAAAAAAPTAAAATVALSRAAGVPGPSLARELGAPLGWPVSDHELVEALVAAAAPGLRWMRDPTRGGVATSLNELARDCDLGVLLFEEKIPIRDTVRGACELLGLDPLHIANEGQFLAVVAPEYADAALDSLRATPGGEGVMLIGEVREQPSGTVLVVTSYGGTRVVDMLVGDPLPRIC